GGEGNRLRRVPQLHLSPRVFLSLADLMGEGWAPLGPERLQLQHSFSLGRESPHPSLSPRERVTDSGVFLSHTPGQALFT
ncbi:MAG: hypothetical protein ACO1QB_04560, partial [Verrucomicrobiales bacterium]